MADLIVKGSIALVTAAFFIGAYLQLQVGFWPSVIAALSVYVTLLLLHALVRRSERVQDLSSEVDRLAGELAQAKTPEPSARQFGKPLARSGPPPAPPRNEPRLDPRSNVPPPMPAPMTAPMAAPMPAAERAPPMPSPVLRADPAFAPPSKPATRPQAASAQAAPAQPALSRAPVKAPPPPAPEAGNVEPTLSPWPDPSASGDSVHDYWSFRPAKAETPEKMPGAAATTLGRFEPRSKETNAPPAENDDDLEAVQGMIKRLAEEVNVGSGAEAAQSAQETATRVSVDALQTTAGTMRAAVSKKAGRGAAKGAAAAPPPIAPVHSQLSSVGAALAVQRVSATIDPIVGLSDQQVHYYELTVRPIDERGNALPADDRMLTGTGLLPLLDSARLTRAAQIAGAFADEGKPHLVFLAVNSESLANDRYLDELANVYRQYPDLAGRLVLTLRQADVARFGGPEWSALTDMRDLGFQFALAGVNDLDNEFTALRAAGFAFVKVDAAQLISGLPAAGHTMPGSDVARYIDEMGLAVIVDQIDNEPARARVVECGARLGQGPLFGAPIAVPSGPSRFGTAAA